MISTSAIREIIRKTRVLFIVDGCSNCRIYKDFINRINHSLPPEKQIKIVDATNYYDFQIVDDPLLKIYLPFLSGSFPTLFLENFQKLEGYTTRIELESWLKSRLAEDFYKIGENVGERFNKDCYFKKIGRISKKTIICTN